MTEAKKILQARADELRLSLDALDADIKLTRVSIKASEDKVREGKEFLNTLVQERVNTRKTVEQLEKQAEVVS